MRFNIPAILAAFAALSTTVMAEKLTVDYIRHVDGTYECVGGTPMFYPNAKDKLGSGYQLYPSSFCNGCRGADAIPHYPSINEVCINGLDSNDKRAHIHYDGAPSGTNFCLRSRPKDAKAVIVQECYDDRSCLMTHIFTPSPC